MAKKYFGTDGVRGEVGQFPINPDFVLKLGYAAGQVLVQHEGEIKPTVLIGKDTRISGYMLEAALIAGLPPPVLMLFKPALCRLRAWRI